MAETVKNQLQVNFSDMLNDKLCEVSEALPKQFNRPRFVQNCLSVLNDKPELAQINKAQLVSGLLRGAYLGVDFMQNECYLVPYGNSVQFQLSYKGSVKFVKRYSIRRVKDIYAKVVRKGDEFTEKIVDGHPTIDFQPLPFNGDEIVGVFAVVLYEDGGMEYETMSTKDINDVRSNYSKACNSKAWKSSWDEMAKKTVLRRLTKHIECDFESTEMFNAWEDGSDFDGNAKRETSEIVSDPFTKSEEPIDVEGTEITDDDLPEFMKG